LKYIHQPVEYWRKNIYSDESIFDTSKRGSAWVMRLPHECYHGDCLEHTFRSGCSTVVVWGAISYNWKPPLVFLEGSGKKKGATMEDYYEQVIEPVVSPTWFDGSWCGGLFVEDGAALHGTKVPGTKHPSLSKQQWQRLVSPGTCTLPGSL